MKMTLGIAGMDRAKAVEIQSHLLDTAEAIDRASEVVFSLDKGDRSALATALGEAVSVLHFELLQAIYEQHPDLQPSTGPIREIPFINTNRRWEETTLPQSISESDLDAIIFSTITTRWRKVAMVVGSAFEKCKARELPIDDEVIGIRIRLLTETGRLENQGDVRYWRFSEVRLPIR
jgi:uncharacterized protein DUF3658